VWLQGILHPGVRNGVELHPPQLCKGTLDGSQLDLFLPRLCMSELSYLRAGLPTACDG